MPAHSRENINSDIWVRFPVRSQRFSLWQKLKGFMHKTLNTRSCWDMAIPSEISLTRISLLAWFSSVIYYESVYWSVFWGSGKVGTTKVTFYVCGLFTAVGSEWPFVCSMFFFSFLRIKEIPYGWKFLRVGKQGYVYWLPSLWTFLALHAAFSFPLETTCY